MTNEEVISILYQYSLRDMTYPKEDIEAFELAIKALEQKKGHWIPSHIPESILDECSECGFSCGAFTFNFSPNCGAKMGSDGWINFAKDLIPIIDKEV